MEKLIKAILNNIAKQYYLPIIDCTTGRFINNAATNLNQLNKINSLYMCKLRKKKIDKYIPLNKDTKQFLITNCFCQKN